MDRGRVDMKIVFFGTPDFVVPILDVLHKEFRERNVTPITAVVTSEPKPVGRDKKVTFSPVDEWAYKKRIPKYFNPKEIIENEIEADLGVLAAYGRIIPKEVIEYFPYGIINIHPSLLPKFRGASPIQGALASGLDQTGVTFMQMDAELDHGPIISSFKENIQPEDNLETLTKKLFERSAEALPSLISAYVAGKINLKSQDHSSASFTTTIKREDGFIPWEEFITATEEKISDVPWKISFIKDFQSTYSPENIDCFVRALSPWPGAWTKVKVADEVKRLKIIKAHVENGKLIPDEVQLEGKNPTNWEQFKEAYLEFNR